MALTGANAVVVAGNKPYVFSMFAAVGFETAGGNFWMIFPRGTPAGEIKEIIVSPVKDRQRAGSVNIFAANLDQGRDPPKRVSAALKVGTLVVRVPKPGPKRKARVLLSFALDWKFVVVKATPMHRLKGHGVTVSRKFPLPTFGDFLHEHL